MNMIYRIIASSYFYISLLALIIIILEIYSAELAYENIGAIYSEIMYGVIFLNIIPILFLIFKKRLVAFLLILSIGFYIIPNQLLLAKKLILLKEEAANIVNYAYMKRIEAGDFPENISDYKFTYPKLSEGVYYQKSDTNDFEVIYHVGTKNTMHFYRHSIGPNWYYNND